MPHLLGEGHRADRPEGERRPRRLQHLHVLRLHQRHPRVFREGLPGQKGRLHRHGGRHRPLVRPQRLSTGRRQSPMWIRISSRKMPPIESRNLRSTTRIKAKMDRHERNAFQHLNFLFTSSEIQLNKFTCSLQTKLLPYHTSLLILLAHNLVQFHVSDSDMRPHSRLRKLLQAYWARIWTASHWIFL